MSIWRRRTRARPRSGVLAGLIGLAAALQIPTGAPAAETTTTRVVDVLDGDSFEARVLGSVQPVRMLGINSTEPGSCHADEARDWLIERIEGRQVQLSADDPDVELTGRPARFVDLDDADIGAEMLALGLVLPYPHQTERSRNQEYLDIAAEARAQGLGIWDDDACGHGPAQDAGLRLVVRWDAEGNDAHNVNGEWLDVYNPSGDPVDLTGWHLRDASTRSEFYHFPPGTVTPARGYVRVHVGVGIDTRFDKYWGLPSPIFDNELDEVAFLFDPDGDLRSTFQYRCRTDCVNDYAALTLSANYDAAGDDNTNVNGEWIDLTNHSDRRISLYGVYVDSHPYAYHFEPWHSIDARSTIRMFVGRGTDTRDVLFWNRDAPMLANAGDLVTLRRKDGLVLERFQWPVPHVSCTVTPPRRSPTPPSDAPADDAPVASGATATAGAERLGVRCD